MDEPMIACSLGAQDYRKRLSSIRTLGEEAFLNPESRPDGAVLSFRKSEQMRAELSSIVEAEAACCFFLELSIRSEGDRMILTILSPPETMLVVRDLTASFQGAPATERPPNQARAEPKSPRAVDHLRRAPPQLRDADGRARGSQQGLHPRFRGRMRALKHPMDSWPGAWPFGIVELVWAGVTLRRYLRRPDTERGSMR